MTVEEVLKRVESIRAARGDSERAHGDEDELREDVLRAIAAGVPNPNELARAALMTSAIEFDRWYA